MTRVGLGGYAILVVIVFALLVLPVLNVPNVLGGI
jgi:hypothetical protein